MIRSAIVVGVLIGALLVLCHHRASEGNLALQRAAKAASKPQPAATPASAQPAAASAAVQKPTSSPWNWSIVYAAGESQLTNSRIRQVVDDELLLTDPKQVHQAFALDDPDLQGDAARDLIELQRSKGATTCPAECHTTEDEDHDTRVPVVREAREPAAVEPKSLQLDLTRQAEQMELDLNDPLDRWLAEDATQAIEVAQAPAEKSASKEVVPSLESSASPASEPAVKEVPTETSADDAGETTTAIKPEVLALQKKVRQALDIYRPKLLNTRDNDAWEVMHSLIAYGVETNVHVGRPGGQTSNAIGWLCYNGACKGKKLFYTSNDRLQAQRGVGVQGHHGQYLAMLAQSRVMSDYPIKCDNRDFTIRDLIEYEKATCQEKTELTFKLIGLAHYLDLNETWKNDYGQEWTISKLIQEEIAQPIRGAPCGGTHRLFGLSYAVQRRMRRGEPIDGEYARAEKYVRDYHRYTFSLQNPDGSLSTDWFKGPGNRNDAGRKVQTSGHILEWLVFSLPDNELQSKATTRAIDFLASTLIAGRNREWEIGPRGHALHALLMYDERINALQQPQDEGEPTGEVAQKAARR